MQPPETPPRHLRRRFRSEIDHQAAALYSESLDSFGGSYYDEDADKIVLLFTGDPELYRDAIAQRTTTPERIVLRRTSRSQAEVDQASSRVVRLVMGQASLPQVNEVGPGLRGDEFVIEVGIDPYSEQVAATIRELVAPEQVIVTYAPTAWEF
jgi:hypothetical protein